MIIPVRTDSPLRRTPWMNWAILLVNVGIFVIQLMGPSLQHHLATYDIGRLAAWFGPLNARDPRLPRYFTYSFLHTGPVHLAVNMLALFIFGNNVNDRMGHLGYLAFYLAGGVFAGIGFVVSEPGAGTVVGASGALMAVLGAYLALYPRSTITVLILVLGAFEVPSMYLIIIFFLIDLVGKFAGPTGVAHVAHLSGMVFGFSVVMGFLWLKLLPRDPFDFLALLQRWNRRRQYQNLVRQGYNPFMYSPRSPRAAGRSRREDTDAKVQRIGDLRAEINEAVAHHNLPHAALLFRQLQIFDPLQVLSRQAQLDVANQLASQQFYVEAADAYEQFLRHYPNFQQIEQVQLMLGIICARYVAQPERARELLTESLKRLHGEHAVRMAREELSRISG